MLDAAAPQQPTDPVNPIQQLLGPDFWSQLQELTRFSFPGTGIGPEGGPSPKTPRPQGPAAAQGGVGLPPLELYLTHSEVVIVAMLPGLGTPGNVAIALTGPKEILLEAFLPPAGSMGAAIHTERFSGFCTRMLTLPVSVLLQGARAQYQDGILEIRLMRAEPGTGDDGVALLRVNPV